MSDLATGGDDVLEEPDADIVLPNGRPRDELWDELERLFGQAVAKTSAHGARNRAHKDLRAYGATVELIRLAARRWSSLYPSATLTDTAIARHWPQLTAGARTRSAPPCDLCGTGGGMHEAGCARSTDGAGGTPGGGRARNGTDGFPDLGGPATETFPKNTEGAPTSSDQNILPGNMGLPPVSGVLQGFFDDEEVA